MKRYYSALSVFFIVLFCSGLNARALERPDLEKFSSMKARSIGPAGMSGRVAAVECVLSNPNVIYVGGATSGVWKSVDGGFTWEPIFDHQPVSSIGAIAVYQKNPSLVWVGTGEGNTRNSAGVGYGIFKSVDGGKTWTHLGLEKTERIHRIILHPDNPDTAFAAAMGTAWGENPERGVYKTADGGKTWEKVLYVDEKVGCADLVMDPQNPHKLFAAMWEYRRWPWHFKSGGPGSGLYVTHDGGKTWKEITHKEGLPQGELGRMGIAIARSNPEIVYALVEAKKNALYRSEDGGETWKAVNDSDGVNPRPFYYCDIRVDPENESRVYRLASRLSVSEDGGKSFDRIARGVHSDHHALWINPENGRFLINGNDGGLAISSDRGNSWRTVKNLPFAQFYHIRVDMDLPYNVYGGMQDNGSWCGPSRVWRRGGIPNYLWKSIGGGDGFDVVKDPAKPEIGYSMWQGGNLIRFNLETGEMKYIKPPAPQGVKLRFNWNAGIAIDPFDPSTIYYGSQFVHKTTDRGESWEIISPDLTTDDPEKQKQAQSGGLTLDVTNAENHCSILTIAPSPVEKGVIWVGTDDGNIQVTTDGGENWTNVVKNIKGLPPHTWCPHIKASTHDSGTAYVVFDDHRRSNWKTYVYKTSNLGKTWEDLARVDPTADKENEVWGFAHVIEEDPVNKNLLFLGTEFGLYVSFDGGNHWSKWTQGVPTVPVRDLVVHPREHDLVVGTHGRGAYIIDDIRPLRKASQEVMQRPLYIFETSSAYIHHSRPAQGFNSPGDTMFFGENEPYGAGIIYVCNPLQEKEEKEEAEEEPGKEKEEKKKEKKVKITITDEEGKVIRETEDTFERGVNRFNWDLRTDGIDFPSLKERERPYYRRTEPEVIPGQYTVKIKMGEHEETQTIRVKPDPEENIPLESRKEKFETIQEYGEEIEVLTEAVNRIKETRKKIDTVLKQLEESKIGEEEKEKKEEAQTLKEEAKKLNKKLDDYLEKVFGPQDAQGITDRSETILSQVTSPLYGLGSSYDAPSPAEKAKLEQGREVLNKALQEVNKIFEEDVTAFAEKYEAFDFELFPQMEPLDLNWKPKKEK